MEDLEVKYVLITGVGGFVGSHLADFLLNKNFTVIGIDTVNKHNLRNLKHIKNQNFIYIKGDLRKFSAIERKLKYNISEIYHLASVVGVNKYISDPSELINNNIISSMNVINFCIKKKIKLIFTSTSEVYGKNPKVPWSENSDRVLGPPNVSRWSYSSSKSLIEHMINSNKTKLNFVIVRYFNVYGPRQNPIFVISNSLHKILNKNKPLIYDNGKQTRCPTYITDAIMATYALSKEKKANKKTFNVGNEKEYTIKKIVESCLHLSGNKNLGYKNFITKKKYGPEYEDIFRRVPDCTMLKKHIKFKIKIDLKTGLKKTIEWIKHNPWYLD